MTCPPRWATPPGDRPTRGPDLAVVAERLGVTLFEWQRLVADIGLELDGDRYVYRTVGAEVGRQNGKTLLAAARIGLELTTPKHRVAFTAQDRNMAREKWDEHCELILESDLAGDVARVVRSNGRERLWMANGASYGIFTPSRKAGRGPTLDLVIIDEALTHSLDVLAAIQPTMITRPDAQLWILSNAGDANSELLAHFRAMGHTPPEGSRLAWFEWAPTGDRFDPGDEAVWHQAVPTLAEDGGVTLDGVRDLFTTMKPDDFAREVLNVWPASGSIVVIDAETWAGLERPDLALPPAGVALGIDVSPDRDHAAICACGSSYGVHLVEVLAAGPGASWVPQRAAELADAWRAVVVVDGGSSAAASLIPDLEALGLTADNGRLEIIGMRDYVRACGGFYDAVTADEPTLAHRGQWELDDAVAGSTKRRLGESWAWNKRGKVDITPLVAATLARYGAVTTSAPRPAVH